MALKLEWINGSFLYTLECTVAMYSNVHSNARTGSTEKRFKIMLNCFKRTILLAFCIQISMVTRAVSRPCWPTKLQDYRSNYTSFTINFIKATQATVLHQHSKQAWYPTKKRNECRLYCIIFSGYCIRCRVAELPWGRRIMAIFLARSWTHVTGLQKQTV